MSTKDRIRLPDWYFIPSRQDSWSVFSACVLLLYIWAVIALFFELPGLIMRGSAAEVIGTAAYLLVVALFESISLFLLLFVFAMILPRKFARSQWAASGSISALTVVFWAIFIQLQGPVIQNWYILQLSLALITVNYSVYKFPKVRTTIEKITSGIQILTNFYLVVSTLCVILVLIRNI